MQKTSKDISKSKSKRLQDFAPHQLEEDLGGCRALATTFLPFPLNPGRAEKQNERKPSSLPGPFYPGSKPKSPVGNLHQACCFEEAREEVERHKVEASS